MRSVLAVALVASFSMTLASAARADDTAPAEGAPAPAEQSPTETPKELDFNGFQLGARTGYARALDATGPQSISSGTPSLLPLAFDIGYRASPKVYLGLTAQLALASRTDCAGTEPCSAKDYRFGAAVQYHLSPFRTFDPWFGAGMGYEIMHLSGFVGDTGGHLTRKGLVLLDAQIGGDFALTRGPNMARGPKLGPFLGLAMGTRSSESGRIRGIDVNSSSGTGHEWVMLGVRGTYDL